MDLSQIQREAEAAREFDHPCADGAVVFSLRLPTRSQTKVAAMRANARPKDPGAIALLERELLVGAVIGWRGPIIGHVLPGSPERGLPFAWSADAVPTLLDAQPDWADALGLELFRRMAQRNAVRDTAEKNSPTASPGSDPEAMRTP